MRDAEPVAPARRSERTAPPSRPKEETARLGDGIYEREIRQQVEADHHGQVVAIDVDSGSWAVGEDEIAAVDRLWTKYAQADDIWCVRVGHRALYSFGGGSLRSAR